MAKEPKLISIDDVLAKEQELVELRKQAIAQLLEERKLIDDKLAKLGYAGASAKPQEVKKRHRRTKAELEAARAAGEKI